MKTILKKVIHGLRSVIKDEYAKHLFFISLALARFITTKKAWAVKLKSPKLVDFPFRYRQI